MHSNESGKLSPEANPITHIGAISQILQVVCQMTGLGFAAVARVTEDRWVACAVKDDIDFGLGVGGELDISTTLCRDVRAHEQTIVIDDAEADSRYCDHPTPKMYRFRAYISTPIHLPGGAFFGTLCAIDPRPMKVNRPEVLNLFSLFADLIGRHLDAEQRAIDSEVALLDEREAAQLREQFIAVLGHDLRNPLGAIRGAVELMQRFPEGPRAELLQIISRSAQRISGLVENLMDLARGRLGQGMQLRRKPDPTLPTVLQHTIDELRTTNPKRIIQSQLQIDCIVDCDSARIAQLLSNLIANAITHGDPACPIKVRGEADETTFELTVSNGGTPIPQELKQHLFEPFVRATARRGQEGLGLGLFIVHEIATAHGGTIQVTSDDKETRFIFRMPCAPESA